MRVFCIPRLNVTHEAFVLGTLDGTASEERAVLLDGEGAPLRGRHAEKGFGGKEGGFGCGTGLTQVGTSELTAVAAIESVVEKSA